MRQKSMAVYCGHQFGNDPKFAEHAAEIGRLMAKNKIRLIFGGGNVGLMGTVAGAVSVNGGWVIGVSTPHVIHKQEPLHEGIKVKVVKNIAARRQKMFELADAFCILPGGTGTLDELTDILVRQQIGESKKPLYFLNTNGYWNIFSRTMAHMNRAGFIEDMNDYNMQIFDTPDDVIREFKKEAMKPK
ncbi:MAG: TIGR00730 family Rossman fold protein [Proteobacteria bacterium]|nr:TIGR00730 family Rossman fold protein [Pseudomonadota bacterium]